MVIFNNRWQIFYFFSMNFLPWFLLFSTVFISKRARIRQHIWLPIIFVAAVIAARIISHDPVRTKIPLFIFQVTLFWLPLFFLSSIPLFFRNWKKFLLALASTLICLMIIYLLGPAILKNIIFRNNPEIDPFLFAQVDAKQPIKGQNNPNDVSNKKPGDVFRIFFLGDSFTYGAGLWDLSLNFPHLVVENLNEKFPGKKIIGYNLGVSGTGPIIQLQLFSTYGKKGNSRSCHSSI